MKKNRSSFLQSDLGRAKPRKHIFHSLINDKLKRHRTDTGLVEDRTSSTTIVRIIAGLLLVHVVIIGGVLCRGQIVKSHSGVAVAPTITPPPAAPAAPAQTEVLPQPIEMTAAPVAPAAPAVAASSSGHITQPVAVADDEIAEEVETAPAALTQPEAPVAAPVPEQTVMVMHHVRSGDTWGRVAAQNGVTVEALKAANPKEAQKSMLISGTYLKVPVDAHSAAGRAQVAQQQAEQAASAARTHTIKKGETLGGIARRYKTSTAKLMKLNNMTEKDTRRIRPGMVIKISE